MVFLRYQDTRQVAMKLLCKPHEFRNEWWRVWEDPQRDMSTLHQMAQPFLEEWRSHLEDVQPKESFAYYALYGRLEEYGDPLEIISEWVTIHDGLDGNFSVREKLDDIFFKLARETKKIPNYGGAAVAFFFGEMFKGYLQREITSARYKDPVIHAESLEFYEDRRSVPPIEFDYFQLDRLQLTPWQSYLLEVTRCTSSGTEMSQLMNIKLSEAYKLRRDLWNELSTI